MLANNQFSVLLCLYFYIVVMSLYVRYADPKDPLFSNHNKNNDAEQGKSKKKKKETNPTAKMVARR